MSFGIPCPVLGVVYEQEEVNFTFRPPQAPFDSRFELSSTTRVLAVGLGCRRGASVAVVSSSDYCSRLDLSGVALDRRCGAIAVAAAADVANAAAYYNHVVAHDAAHYYHEQHP